MKNPVPRICLIHAVRVAIDPVAEAFARLWPEAQLMHLLDDSLSVDRQRDGMLTAAMFEEALGAGLRLGLLASFTPSIAPLAEEFAAMSAARCNRDLGV